jgi:hypothetical protein
MVPSPTVPLAQHASFGQQRFAVSLGSAFVCRNDRMPLDASFFYVLLTFSPVRDSVGELLQ